MSAFLPMVPSCWRNVFLTCFLTTLPLSARSLPAPTKQPQETVHAVKPEMELLITHPYVLDSAEARYPGALSFGHLMEQLAGSENASSFTLKWLSLWLHDQTVNADVAPARLRMQELVLDPWRKYDQEANDEDDDPFTWIPNLAHAPFKLIAVVNRMDLVAPGVVAAMKDSAETAQKNLSFLSGNLLALTDLRPKKEFTLLNELFRRQSPEGMQILEFLEKTARVTPAARKPKPEVPSEFISTVATGPEIDTGGSSGGGYGGGSGASGEGRLVFAVTDSNGVALEPGFNVIFEFSLRTPVPAPKPTNAPPTNERPIRNLTEHWAAKWHQLGAHDEFGPDYLRDLVLVTKGFTESRMGMSSTDPRIPPPLSQLRTNDGVLDTSREFRQFKLVSPIPPQKDLPRLRLVPVSQTPAEHFQSPERSAVLAKVLKTQQEDFRKKLSINLPMAVQWTKEKEPTGLLGARSLIIGDPKEFRWVVPEARDKALVKEFSQHTCNGCHGADTVCENGCHLNAGAMGTLKSTFLSKEKDGVPQGEMKERAYILKTLLEVENESSKVALLRLLQQRHRKTH
jgi:hypothetical protein